MTIDNDFSPTDPRLEFSTIMADQTTSPDVGKTQELPSTSEPLLSFIDLLKTADRKSSQIPEPSSAKEFLDSCLLQVYSNSSDPLSKGAKTEQQGKPAKEVAEPAKPENLPNPPITNMAQYWNDRIGKEFFTGKNGEFNGQFDMLKDRLQEARAYMNDAEFKNFAEKINKGTNGGFSFSMVEGGKKVGEIKFDNQSVYNVSNDLCLRPAKTADSSLIPPTSIGAENNYDNKLSLVGQTSPDDPLSSYKVEANADLNKYRITDTDKRVSLIETVPGSNEVKKALFYGKDGQLNGMIEDGVYKSKSGEQKIKDAQLKPDGSVTMKFEDGTQRTIGPNGYILDKDSQGRPTKMIDARGNEFVYKNWQKVGDHEQPGRVDTTVGGVQISYHLKSDGNYWASDDKGEVLSNVFPGMQVGNLSAGRPLRQNIELRVGPSGDLMVIANGDSWSGYMKGVKFHPDGSQLQKELDFSGCLLVESSFGIFPNNWQVGTPKQIDTRRGRDNRIIGN